MGEDTLPVDLSSPGSFTPDFFSSGLGEGFILGGSVSSMDIFASRVVEEPVGRTSQVGSRPLPHLARGLQGFTQLGKSLSRSRRRGYHP